jgi:hypothetical protein
MGFRLITDEAASSLDEFEYIFEEKDRNQPRSLFIQGPYMLAEAVNRNKRRYPIHEMRSEVDRYTREMIGKKRAMGELNHPSSADVDLERACHLVEYLKEEKEGDRYVFVGRSKVLTTPCGKIVHSLVNDGVTVGMSSRALGQLTEKTSYNEVQNMRLVAIDCVADPSFSEAFVNGILESKEWVLKDDGHFEEHYDAFEKSFLNIPSKEKQQYLTEQIIKFLKNIH